MTFLKKHPLLIVSLLLVVVCLGLYLFLVKPVMVRRQGVAKTIEENLAQLRRHRDDPPSLEMVAWLNQEKERLEKQYEEVVERLHFPRRVALPEDPGDPLFLDEQIEKFERQIERAEDELGRLAERIGINIPERLGFGRERPENEEELSILLSQLFLTRALVTLIIEAGVSDLFVLNPLPLPAMLPRREMPPEIQRLPGMPPEIQRPPGMPPEIQRPPGMRPRREVPLRMPLGMEPLGIKELRFELGVRAEISALTNFLYQIATHPYFFAVQDIDIRSVRVRRERALPEVRERDRLRRRRVPRRRGMPPEIQRPPGMHPGMPPEIQRPPGMHPGMPPEIQRPPGMHPGMPPRREVLPRPPRPPRMEFPLRMEPEEVEGELEVRLLIATRLLPPSEEE